MVVSSRVLQGYRGLDINNKATMKQKIHSGFNLHKVKMQEEAPSIA